MPLIMKTKSSHYLRVGFSLRKEIFFVAIGSIIGGLTMHMPRILFDISGGPQYNLTLLVAASVLVQTYLKLDLHFTLLLQQSSE